MYYWVLMCGGRERRSGEGKWACVWRGREVGERDRQGRLALYFLFE